MTEKERKERIKEILKELKELQATPRSDWHAAFDSLLRIDMYDYADKVHIQTEEEIGVIPPRIDYVLLVEDEDIEFEKAIFQIFRRINILEYKNPNDSLNEQVIRKACGYANLYIGNATHKGERPSDQVTISIFRSKKNVRLFREMQKNGTLVADKVPGIYHVQELVDLPFQIIITTELKGNEYAAYRALTNHANQKDLVQVMNQLRQEKNENVREYYHTLLKLISDKNPELIEKIKGDEKMGDILMEIMKDRVEEKIRIAVNEAVEEKDKELQAKDQALEAKDQALEAQKQAIEAKDQVLEAKDLALKEKDEDIVSYIRNFASSLSLSVDQVIEFMNIPETKKSNIRTLLMQQPGFAF